ncbi:MAG: hypothetical protein HY721_13630 [Planctomycetes bacterium]|nr:hypothetical protein [Planctomycetota bacterium]
MERWLSHGAYHEAIPAKHADPGGRAAPPNARERKRLGGIGTPAESSRGTAATAGSVRWPRGRT